MSVQIPTIGAYYFVPELNRRIGVEKDNKDICWEIVATETYQSEPGQFKTICTMRAVWYEDDERDDPDFDLQRVDLDMYDNTDI